MLSKQKAFSLLELLLVIVCIAAITSWAVHHYQVTQRRAQTAQIESDVKSLQRALDSYFHVTGCKQSGVFEQTTVDCETQLKPGSDVVCSRSPLVSAYQAQVIDTGQKTTDVNAKPIYRLEISAVLNTSQLSSGQITWYKQTLRASSASTGAILKWDSLPSNSYVQLGDGSWVLNGSTAFFKATENRRGTLTNVETSGSYCAN